LGFTIEASAQEDQLQFTVGSTQHAVYFYIEVQCSMRYLVAMPGQALQYLPAGLVTMHPHTLIVGGHYLLP
jgi:hypothetical protein